MRKAVDIHAQVRPLFLSAAMHLLVAFWASMELADCETAVCFSRQTALPVRSGSLAPERSLRPQHPPLLHLPSCLQLKEHLVALGIPLQSCGEDSLPLRRALVAGLFPHAAKRQMDGEEEAGREPAGRPVGGGGCSRLHVCSDTVAGHC